MATIVIVEDERDLNTLIRRRLEHDGYAVYPAYDWPTGLALVEQQRPDLAIPDWMLPGLDGLAVCRAIREQHLMPIIMLTARSEKIDRVMGLEVGADDYVVKPFSIRELLARVRSILRRVALDIAIKTIQPARDDTLPDHVTMLPPPPAPLIYGSLRIDLSDRRVRLGDQNLDLTRREFDLLALLATHPGRAFSREFLLEHVWDMITTARIEPLIVMWRRRGASWAHGVDISRRSGASGIAGQAIPRMRQREVVQHRGRINLRILGSVTTLWTDAGLRERAGNGGILLVHLSLNQSYDRVRHTHVLETSRAALSSP